MISKNILTGAALLACGSMANAATLNNDLGGAYGFGENEFGANDDSSVYVDLSGVFSNGLDFFGTNYSGLYLNNNGNVTFAVRQATYTPSAITGNTSNPIIATFFADVDTRGGVAANPNLDGNSMGSNKVFYDLDATNGVFTATWDDVGFYSHHVDPTNAFQLILSDSGNGDFDIEFRYEEINWTAGTASGGNAAGLGGTTARAGWSSGNGVDFEELSESGNEDEMLDLENRSNVGEAGVFRWSARNGNVINVPTPATLGLLGLIVLGLGVARKRQA